MFPNPVARPVMPGQPPMGAPPMSGAPGGGPPAMMTGNQGMPPGGPPGMPPQGIPPQNPQMQQQMAMANMLRQPQGGLRPISQGFSQQRAY